MKVLLLIAVLSASAGALSYRQVTGVDGKVVPGMIQRIDDSAFIPTDSENRDYQQFLQWEKEGNRIEPPFEIPSEDPIKKQAYEDLNNKTKTEIERFEALIKYLGLEKIASGSSIRRN